MAPVGLGDWRIITSLISGFMAKESVVAVMTSMFGDSLASLGTVTAVSMLVFSLIYTPCVAAVAAIRREMGRRWALSVVIFQCVLAWVMAFIARMICILCGLR
jgi:ferrous iron transport protein B